MKRLSACPEADRVDIPKLRPDLVGDNETNRDPDRKTPWVDVGRAATWIVERLDTLGG